MTIFAKYARLIRTATLGAFVAGTLAACGGGGGASGTPVNGGGGGGTTTPSALADLSLVMDATSVPNDGSKNGVLTITSLDSGRKALGSVPLAISVQDPANTAFLTAGSTTDAATGVLAATVSIGSNRTNRTITITAGSGTIQRSVSVNVVTPTTTTPLAADMTIVLDKISIGNTGSDRVKAVVTAVDASRNVVAGIPIKFTVDNGATVAVINGTTDALGQAAANVTSGSDKSNRLITVTATSDSLTRTATFQVLGAKLQGTAVPSQPTAGSTNNRVDYRLSDINQNPMTFQAITISAPGLPSASGTTDANGAYTYVYTAPTTAGPIDITANGGGVTSVVTVTVPSSTSTVPTASPAVVSASVAASPTVVSVNTDSTNNRAELRALFLAASNAPVKNVRVRFDLNGDANSIGGTISAGTQLVYSDAGGVATTSYSPAGRSSPTNGVTIRACWDYNDFPVGTCPNSTTATLTVVSDPLSISIGTSSAVDETNPLVYIKRFVVLVVDAAGQPKGDVQITPSLDLTGYYKGFFQFGTTVWLPFYYLDVASSTTIFPGSDDLPVVCKAEDLNKNGAIDAGEDKNNNGQLDPRKSDASISMEGSTRTDANGQAVIVLTYPRNMAWWVGFKIDASAPSVLSPPATFSGRLPYPVTAVNNRDIAPPMQKSPYGQIRKSTDPVYCTNAD